MCKTSERAQRRHRAVYIAPSAGPHHHHHRHFGIPPGDGSDQVIPLLVEVPAEPVVVSPPSSGQGSVDLSSLMLPPPLPRWRRFVKALTAAYHWLVDLLLVLVVCFMGCLFYDVEVRVVKSSRREARQRGRSGRVVIEGSGTSPLLRTPPRSCSMWGGSEHSRRSRESPWEV
jgi:hypothetical protein